jgi:hypothetical protein
MKRPKRNGLLMAVLGISMVAMTYSALPVCYYSNTAGWCRNLLTAAGAAPADPITYGGRTCTLDNNSYADTFALPGAYANNTTGWSLTGNTGCFVGYLCGTDTSPHYTEIFYSPPSGYLWVEGFMDTISSPPCNHLLP